MCSEVIDGTNYNQDHATFACKLLLASKCSKTVGDLKFPAPFLSAQQ